MENINMDNLGSFNIEVLKKLNYGGFYVGKVNIEEPIILNRKELKNPSGFILGKSGTGMNFSLKSRLVRELTERNK